MSQILCWDYKLTSSKFNESIVFCENREKVLDYLTSIRSIIFKDKTLQDNDNLLLLTIIKLSCPRTELVYLDGDSKSSFFKNIKEVDIDEYIANSVVRPFVIEDKIASIKEAFTMLIEKNK